MSSYFRAIAVDFDGTLTEGARPDDAVLEAVADLRATGVRIILATGRILGELRHGFPDVDEHFDAIVAENGALTSGPHGRRLLADPVDDILEDALLRRHVPVRSGEVLLACDASHDQIVLEEIGRLGLDCQILRNRAALMVLPAGVTKASGLLEALGDLGVSRHSTITIGDAENDRRLLEVGEYGVAVANAVEALKIHADLVLDEPDGRGVVQLLQGPLFTGAQRAHSARWRIDIGVTSDGRPVTVPAAQINVLIAGGTRMGKSYIAGLLAEAVTDLGYSAVVVDIEGDHLGLDHLRAVLSVGGLEPLPKPDEVYRLIRHRFGSVVLDLSLLTTHEQDHYIAAIPPAIERERNATGLPHWMFVDEAHRLAHFDATAATAFQQPLRGVCLVSYRPEDVSGISADNVDVVVLTAGLEPEQIAHMADATGRTSQHLTALLHGLPLGRAVIVEPTTTPECDRRFSVRARRTTHVRHWHKYARRPLDPSLHFAFRTRGGQPTGNVATSLYEFHHILRQSADDVIEHHVAHHDLSHWIQAAIRDDALSDSFAGIEDALGDADIDSLRHALVKAIEHRYLD